MSWTCAHCTLVNTIRETLCDRCSAERLAPIRPLAWAPARPAELPVEIVLTPEEDAIIRRELARFRALLGMPPRPDTPPEAPPAPPEAPTGRPVRVLARRVVPASRGWWRRSEAG